VNKPQQDSYKIPDDWPKPGHEEREVSQKLVELIISEISENNGQISFERYMGMVLNEPGYGYYSAGARKFGKHGDFTTAPEISPLFSACLARQCEQIFELTGSNTILELGAGSGVMASDILTDLNRRSNLPEEYLILETSAELRDRQKQRLAKDHPQLIDRIKWLDSLPDHGINGVVLANEVLDALPVSRVRLMKDNLYELMVGQAGNDFIWQSKLADNNLSAETNRRLGQLTENLPNEYETEINCLIPAFLRSLSDVLNSGAILLIDYGYPRHEYYHSQRSQGTLVCHYRHHSHDNPFLFVGIQDITAFVDFTTVAESAHESGLNVKGYSTQAGFLMSVGLEEIIKEYSKDENTNLILSQQAGQLLLPGQMGEKFKVLALTRNIQQELDGFKLLNATHRL
jgi:SAM-dependent MidA family methyltransferase